MKVAIYCRVSTEKQELENQIEICKKYCEIKGWEIFDIYADVISGKKESRPEFNRLLKDMRDYKFGAVVVSKLDRLARSLKHLLNLVEEFNSKGVHFITATQIIDTTSPTGKLQFQIMGAFAEFEASIISDRTKEGMAGKENVGKRGKDKKPRKKRGAVRKPIFTLEN
jgi:DNA invertase Pin-like site-specific DNA recombinase